MAKKSGRYPTTEEGLALRNEANLKAALDENGTAIAHSLAGLSAPPVNLMDIEEVERRTMEYIADCQRTGAKVSPPSLALWLGITSADLAEWLTTFGTEEHRRSAARIYQFLHASFVDNALNGRTSPQLSMFLAKNWFGYRDSQAVETAQTVDTRKSLDELAKEAENLPDFEIIETQGQSKKSSKKSN